MRCFLGVMYLHDMGVMHRDIKELLADSDKISFLGQDMFFLGQAELIWGINF